MAKQLKKFSSQADLELLEQMQEIAKEEGMFFHTLIEEAFRDLIEKKKEQKPRVSVLKHFKQSLDAYEDLYKDLAK